ncbi:GntR family transcriptional regulator [Actinacidiphila yeochonensis]|uniref:GntR family transcriptional regulator n=1 Tax=Actinacidiphila yeochonensis TaxID=89050 RepID=UPI000566C8A8|nr:winged helix-turn-helix domain-containing protein [Actinacidiphila yeochonensis]
MRDEAVQPYQRIALDMRDKIAAGELQPGEKLPSTRELAEKYAVAAGTVQRALSELRATGAIYSHQGRGSYVAGAAAEATEDPTTRALRVLEDKVAKLTERLDKIEKTHDGA